MPNVTMPNGMVIRDVPAGTSQAELLRRLSAGGYTVEELLTPPQKKSAIEEVPLVGGALSAVADIPLSFAEGLAGTGKTFTDLFGADNVASEFLSDVSDYARELKSAASREDSATAALIQKQAEDKGIWEQVKAAARAFARSPLETTASVAGSAVPFIAAGLATEGAAIPAMLTAGAASGAGMIKGSIHDAVYEEFKNAGASEEQALAAASRAQEYGGENLDQIALGSAMGALASATGFSRQIASTLGRKVAQRVATEGVEQAVAQPIATTAARSWTRGIVPGALEEAVPEAAQAAQERYAQNLALQREGFDIDAWRGVAGQAAFEGIASLILGGYGGAREVSGEAARTRLKEAAEEFEAMSDAPTDDEKTAAIERFVRRGFNVPEATTVVDRMATQKEALRQAEEDLRREREEASTARTAGIDETPFVGEPDINAPGMPPADMEGRPSYVPDAEEQAAMQRAYEQEVGLEPITTPPTTRLIPPLESVTPTAQIRAQLAPTQPPPARNQPTEVTPFRATQLLNDPVQLSDFMARTGMDEQEAIAELSAIEEGESTGLKYARRPKDTGTADMFGALPVQAAPGEEMKRAEFEAFRFAPEERKAALQEQAAQEAEAAKERIGALRQRDIEQREETLGDIEYALRAQAPENAVYKVVYDPTSNSSPYRLVAETRLGEKPEKVLTARTLQDFSDKVYGQMMELTPYIEPGPAATEAMEQVEQIEPLEQKYATPATRMVQEFTSEVDAAREAGEINDNERAQLINRLYRPDAYRTLPNGRQVPNDAIAKLEVEALEAAAAARDALADEKESKAALSKEANDRLRAAVRNNLLNPARAAFKSMVENRQLEKEGAGIRVKEAKQVLQKEAKRRAELEAKYEGKPDMRAQGRKLVAETSPEVEEAKREIREAKIDIKEAKVQKYRRAAQAKGTSVDGVQNVVDAIVKDWKSTNPVVAVQSIADIKDRKLRNALMRDNASDAKGFVTPDGTVYLIADNLDSEADAKAVLFHEALGHLGLEKLFRNNLDAALTTMYRGNKKLRADTDKWRQANPGAYEKDTNPLARAVEEVLAERSEAGVLEPTLMQRIAGVIRNFARRMGFKVAISDADVNAILAMAHDQTVNGPQISTAVKGMRYIEDRIRVPSEAAKTFLKELGLFTNRELMAMDPEEAITRAARIGVDQEWLDYFNSRRLAARAPEGQEPIKLPQPDMAKYMPKYARPKTKPKTAEELEEGAASLSAGARRTNKTQNTYAMNDGIEEMAAGHQSKPFVKAVQENISDIAPPFLERMLSAMPTSGILGWYGNRIPELEKIDDLVHRMTSMKHRIILSSDKLARELDDFIRVHGTEQLARTQSVSRINEVAPDEFASLEEALKKNAVIEEIEKLALANSNNKAETRRLMDEIKALVVAKKDAVRVEGDKVRMSEALKGKLDAMSKLAVDRTKTEEHVQQLAEMTRRIRDVKAEWEKLSKQEGGHRLYKEMRSFYKDMFDAELALLDERIGNIADEEQAKRIRDVRAKLMHEIKAPDKDKKAGDLFHNINADLFAKDYFPFMREGKYWLRVIGDKSGKREPEFYAFNSARERNAAQRATAKRLGVDPEDSSVIRMGNDIGDLQQDLRDEDVLMQQVFNIVGKARAEFETSRMLDMKELTDAIYQTWLLTTPERSVRRRLMHAEEVVGFSQDILLHFKQQAATYANQLSKLSYAGQVRTAVGEARDNLEEMPSSQQAQYNTVIGEMEKRVNQELNPDPHSAVVNFLNRASYFYYLTSAASALIQTTSIPIRVVPRLWRDYGFAKGTAMWIKYMKLWKSLGRVKVEHTTHRFGDTIDGIMPNVNGSQFVKDSADLRWAMDAGNDRGILETVSDTIVQNERETPGKTRSGAAQAAGDVLANTGKVMSFMFTGMENISRQAAYYMTFELALDKYRTANPGASNDDAREYAFREAMSVVRDTLGDYTNWERPSLVKNNWTRALFLFKMHPILQTKFMIGAVRDVINGLYPGASAEAKAARNGAFKELTGVTMMAGMFGGLMGMPLYSIMAYALAEGFDDEDDEDVKQLIESEEVRVAYDSDIMFRKWVMEKFGDIEVAGMPLSDILIHGPISTLSNTDLASRTSLDLKNMWFRDAIGGDSTEDTMIQTAIGNIAGLNMVAQMARAYDSFAAGDNKGALTKALPAFFRSWVASAYEASEGIKDRKGNVIIPKEDIAEADSARSMLGFRPMRLARWQDYYITAAKNEKKIEGEKKQILDTLERKVRDGDITDMDGVREYYQEEIVPFNRTYPDPDFVITSDTVLKSLKSRAATRARTVEGMQVTKKGAEKALRTSELFRP